VNTTLSGIFGAKKESGSENLSIAEQFPDLDDQLYKSLKDLPEFKDNPDLLK